MSRHDFVIEALRRANPVPTTEAEEPVVDDVFDSVIERTRGMIGTESKPSTHHGKPRRGWPRVAAVVAGLVVLAGVAAVLVQSGSIVASDPARGDTSVEHMTVIREAVESINLSDYEGLAGLFVDRGEITPAMDFEVRASCCGSYPISSAASMEAWLTVLDAWGAEAEIERCEPDGETMVRCHVVTGFDVLAMEWVSDWAFIFTTDGELGSLLIPLGDLAAEPESQPLNLNGVREWEAWLIETDPAEAERLLGRSAPGPTAIPVVNGVEIHSSLLPYDPSLAGDIGDSIEEYLRAR